MREPAALRTLLGDGPFDTAYRLGSGLPRMEALALALATGRGGPERIAINSR